MMLFAFWCTNDLEFRVWLGLLKKTFGPVSSKVQWILDSAEAFVSIISQSAQLLRWLCPLRRPAHSGATGRVKWPVESVEQSNQDQTIQTKTAGSSPGGFVVTLPWLQGGLGWISFHRSLRVVQHVVVLRGFFWMMAHREKAWFDDAWSRVEALIWCLITPLHDRVNKSLFESYGQFVWYRAIEWERTNKNSSKNQFFGAILSRINAFWSILWTCPEMPKVVEYTVYVVLARYRPILFEKCPMVCSRVYGHKRFKRRNGQLVQPLPKNNINGGISSPQTWLWSTKCIKTSCELSLPKNKKNTVYISLHTMKKW